ncbi:hypothetical protein [Ralstonia thomasii]|jgi:hypothetical protein
MGQRYRNPSNGYTEEVGYGACYGVFFLGPLYLAAKGLWGHVFIWLLLVALPGIASGGPLLLLMVPLASIGYAAAIQGILEKKYLKAGWEEVGGPEIPASATIGRKCPFCAEEIKVEAIRCKHCHADLSSVPTA